MNTDVFGVAVFHGLRNIRSYTSLSRKKHPLDEVTNNTTNEAQFANGGLTCIDLAPTTSESCLEVVPLPNERVKYAIR